MRLHLFAADAVEFDVVAQLLEARHQRSTKAIPRNFTR